MPDLDCVGAVEVFQPLALELQRLARDRATLSLTARRAAAFAAAEERVFRRRYATCLRRAPLRSLPIALQSEPKPSFGTVGRGRRLASVKLAALRPNKSPEANERPDLDDLPGSAIALELVLVRMGDPSLWSDNPTNRFHVFIVPENSLTSH